MFLGLVEQVVAGVQHILGVVEFAGDRVLDVVDLLEHVAARHHATVRRRDAAGFVDDRAQLIERLKYSVHGTPSRRSCRYQCAWCYPCDYANAVGVSPSAFSAPTPGQAICEADYVSPTLCQCAGGGHTDMNKDRPRLMRTVFAWVGERFIRSLP